MVEIKREAIPGREGALLKVDRFEQEPGAPWNSIPFFVLYLVTQ
jgi:hypothetical protein